MRDPIGAGLAYEPCWVCRPVTPEGQFGGLHANGAGEIEADSHRSVNCHQCARRGSLAHDYPRLRGCRLPSEQIRLSDQVDIPQRMLNLRSGQ